MIYNLIQKYLSVLFAFFNMFLIIQYLDIEYLGFYAFLTASGTVYSVFVTAGIRSIYLRETVKYRENLEAQQVFSVFAEIMTKATGLITCVVFFSFATFFSFDTKDAVTVALIGTVLGSSQLTSQKVRSHGLNTLSQIILNVRPIIFTILLLFFVGVLGNEALQNHFRALIIISFFLPAILAYAFWIARYHNFVFVKVALNDLGHKVKSLVKEMPGLVMLAFGQKAISQSDVIFVNALLGLDAAGIYRLVTQIVTTANASLFAIRSKFVRKYSQLINKHRTKEAKEILRQVAKIGMALYIAILFIFLIVLYRTPYLNDIKYLQDFYVSLGIMAVTGLVKAVIPMIESYIVFSNNTNKGGLIQLGVFACNVILLLVLVPLFGLPGACTATLLIILFWRMTVKHFLK